MGRPKAAAKARKQNGRKGGRPKAAAPQQAPEDEFLSPFFADRSDEANLKRKDVRVLVLAYSGATRVHQVRDDDLESQEVHQDAAAYAKEVRAARTEPSLARQAV